MSRDVIRRVNVFWLSCLSSLLEKKLDTGTQPDTWEWNARTASYSARIVTCTLQYVCPLWLANGMGRDRDDD